MAYIAPNSTIEFFPDFGVDPGYENTMYFASEQAKDTYFDGIIGKIQVTAQSYTRGERGVVKVQKTMAEMYKKGYMRYKNTSFENKWFYAFITSVEYINNITTAVHFEIDVMMTWMGDFTLGDCFIERQHTTTDVIGENTKEEGLETGEYVIQTYSQTNLFNDYAIYIFQTLSNATGEAEGITYGGIYSGLHMYYCVDEQSATDHINAMITANNLDSLVMIMILPTHFIPDHIHGSAQPTLDRFLITKPYTDFYYGTDPESDPQNPPVQRRYTPRNKKLFCYPYNFLTVYNTEGESADYRYEDFNGCSGYKSVGQAAFTVRGVCNAESEISCIPEGYKGLTLNYGERLTMKKFPQCAWGADSYKAYIAQVQSGLGVALVSSAFQAYAGAMMGNPFTLGSAVGTGIGEISKLVAMHANKPAMPAHAKGSQSADLFVAMGAKDFYFLRMCITKEYAQIIDSYFDMYGYAIKEHGTPNMNARPKYTYVKTVGCVVKGEMPADDSRKIEEIFDKGVRFWKNHNEIGNYGVNNRPT